MAIDADLVWKPAYELRELIAKKQLSPVELIDLCLEHVDRLNPKLNAFLTVSAEEARRDAREAEAAVMRGDELGPLHGVPVSVKDLLDTKGTRTTLGSLVYKDRVPEEDDLAVARLRAAGAVILGKTNTPEFGQGGATTQNRLIGDCRNPWDLDRVSGGSSGGAAVSVASGMNPLALGTDGGGSVRIPSSFCGIYGIKPTQGRVPQAMSGQTSWLPTRVFQTSPMTRTVLDAAVALQVIAGPHPRAEPGTMQERLPDFKAGLDHTVKGLRMAWSPDMGSAAVEPEVQEAAERAALAFSELGATVEAAPFHVDVAELSVTHFTLVNTIYYLRDGGLLQTHADLLTPIVVKHLQHGRTVTGAEYARALADLERHRAYVADFFTQYQLLLTPTVAIPAFAIGQRPTHIGGRPLDPFWGFWPFTFPFNASENPAATVPCGFSTEGLPIGLQIVGRKGDDVTVLRASAAFEEARPWADKRPTVS